MNLMGQNVKNQKSGIAAGYLVLTIIGITVAVTATIYILTPRTSSGENVPDGGENTWPIRHLVDSGTGETNVGTDVGKVAPNFVDSDNDAFSLTSLRGKVVVLDFMATWCGPCRDEMSHLKEIFAGYSSEQVVIISIDVDPTESDVAIKQFKEDYGDNWVFASGSDVGTTYGAVYIPTVYIIDKQGIVAYKNTGLVSSSVLSTEIDKLL